MRSEWEPILSMWENEAVGGAGQPEFEGRYKGVVLGAAVGNLLGVPVEGMSRDWVRRAFPQGVTDIDPTERDAPVGR